MLGMIMIMLSTPVGGENTEATVPTPVDGHERPGD